MLIGHISGRLEKTHGKGRRWEGSGEYGRDVVTLSARRQYWSIAEHMLVASDEDKHPPAFTNSTGDGKKTRRGVPLDTQLDIEPGGRRSTPRRTIEAAERGGRETGCTGSLRTGRTGTGEDRPETRRRFFATDISGPAAGPFELKPVGMPVPAPPRTDGPNPRASRKFDLFERANAPRPEGRRGG